MAYKITDKRHRWAHEFGFHHAEHLHDDFRAHPEWRGSAFSFDTFAVTAADKASVHIFMSAPKWWFMLTDDQKTILRRVAYEAALKRWNELVGPAYNAEGDQVRPFTEAEELQNAEDELRGLKSGEYSWDDRMTKERAIEHTEREIVFRKRVIAENVVYEEDLMRLWKEVVGIFPELTC